MKKENSQSSTYKKEMSRVISNDWLKKYRASHIGPLMPLNKEHIANIAKEFYNAVLNDPELVVAYQYFAPMEMTPMQIKQFKESNEEFNKWYVLGLEAIGVKRELKSMERDSATIIKSMKQYSSMWRDDYKYEADTKKTDTQSSGDVTVIFPDLCNEPNNKL